MTRFAIVFVDETCYWDEEFRQQHKIKSIGRACILDRERRVHYCELTPSSELTPIHNVITYTDAELSEEERERAEEDVMTHDDSDPIIMHCRDALKLPSKEVDNIDKLLDEPVSDDDETYWKQVDQIREYYQSNWMW